MADIKIPGDLTQILEVTDTHILLACDGNNIVKFDILTLSNLLGIPLNTHIEGDDLRWQYFTDLLVGLEARLKSYIQEVVKGTTPPIQL